MRDLTGISIFVVIVCVCAHFVIKVGREESRPTSDTIGIDSIPTSKCYQKTIVVRGGSASGLGSNPMIDHKVPCDYEGNSNNWDEDLENIK